MRYLFGLIVFAAIIVGISGCSGDAGKLVGTWVSESGDSIINIKPGKLLIDYTIEVSGDSRYLQEACKTLVLYSNNGFNCYGFPDKTARIMYQSNLQPESDILVATSANDGSFINYHHFH